MKKRPAFFRAARLLPALVGPVFVHADPITWLAAPSNADWSTFTNWSPGLVPNSPADTAVFAGTATPGVSLSAFATVNGITFTPAAAANPFTITVLRSNASVVLELSGAGIINNSGTTQSFVAGATASGVQGNIRFSNAATAGTQTSFLTIGGADGSGGGEIDFVGTATAGAATFTNRGAVEAFSSGGSTTLTEDATADTATFAAEGSTVADARGGLTAFTGNARAGSATLITLGGSNDGEGGTTSFSGSADGGNARAITQGNGRFDISGITAGALQIGSIEGSGYYYLGGKRLTAGGNGLSTTVTGILFDAGNGGSLAKVGAGTLTLMQSNSFSGGVSVSGGRLQAAANGALGTGAATITGGTLEIAADTAVANAITLTAGTLAVNGTTQTGQLTLTAGTITGTGTINQPFTLGQNLTLAPGNGPGTLHTVGENWAGGGRYLWEFNRVTAAGGNQTSLRGLDLGADFLALAGQLSITATSADPFRLDLAGLDLAGAPGAVDGWDPNRSYQWTLATASGGIFGFATDKFALDATAFAAANAVNGIFSLGQTGNDLVLSYVAVLEPTTFALLAIGGLAIAGLRTRFRRQSRKSAFPISPSPMKTAIHCLALAAAIHLVPASAQAAGAQGWTATSLHPAGATSSYLRATTGTQQAGVAYFSPGFSTPHAGIWAGSPANFVDLHPSGATSSVLDATNGAQQAGSITVPIPVPIPAPPYVQIEYHEFAVMWAGTAASAVNLHPATATTSHLRAIAGTQQAGYAVTDNSEHAVVWAGTAASFQDIHPDGSTESFLTATTGTQQAGRATFNGHAHAGIWAGTKQSFVDLNPSGASASYVAATTGAQQAGGATINGDSHAGTWVGTAASFTDLNPAGTTSSELYATTGTRQAGYAYINGESHAGIWAGTAASFVDLHSVLPAAYTSSAAYAIWTDGVTILVAGDAENAVANRQEAMLWRFTFVAPTVRVSGKHTRRVAATKLTFKGTAADANGDLARVEVKVGKAKWKKARGLEKWRFVAYHLKIGRTKIQVRATDTTGLRSSPARLTIIRQSH